MNITDITLGEFVSEYRKRARIKADELSWTLSATNCDEDLASFLFLTVTLHTLISTQVYTYILVSSGRNEYIRNIYE